MINLPDLPPLKEKEENESGNIKSRTSDGLPSLHKADFSSHLDNSHDELMLTGDLAEEYKKIKSSYRELINSFERSLQQDMKVVESERPNLKYYKFRSISDFESAVENGFLNLEDYTSKEINDLIKDLNELENRLITRDLNEYNFKTIDDFQDAVDRGIIDLSRYDIKEINELLDNLEDESLEIDDYEIEMFGDVRLPDIEDIINTKQPPERKRSVQREPSVPKKAKRKQKVRPNYYAKPSNLPSPPRKRGPKKQTSVSDPPKHISDEENIEDLLDNNIFKKISKWFKRLIQKRDP